MKQQVFNKADGIKAIAWLSSLIPSLDDKKKYVVEVKQYCKGRSLDANAYCWVLIDKLAEKICSAIRQPREEVKKQIYRNAVRDIGGVSETICVQNKAVDKIRQAWEIHGLGWQTETFPSKIDGCTNITMYYGSSVYDTAQMSRLIDSIVQDCNAVGIETMTPAELEALKEQWK